MSYQQATEKIIRSMSEEQKEFFIEKIALIVSETRLEENQGGSYNKEQAFDKITELLKEEKIFY
jgi:hypothetical protein